MTAIYSCKARGSAALLFSFAGIRLCADFHKHIETQPIVNILSFIRAFRDFVDGMKLKISYNVSASIISIIVE